MPTAYGVFAAAGCIVAVLWLRAHREGLRLSDNAFWVAVWTMVLGATVGAKALFVALGWELYTRGELRLWADFGVGFVFFGGLVGAAAAGWGIARVLGLSFTRGADYFAVAVPMGHAIGRVGCFLTGCCGGHPPHPVQLYEAAGLALIAWSTRGALGRVQAGVLANGSAFWLYLAFYGILRLALDPLRADGRPERWLGLSAQQGLAMAVTAAAVLAWARAYRTPGSSWRSPRRLRGRAMSHMLPFGCVTPVWGLYDPRGGTTARWGGPLARLRSSRRLSAASGIMRARHSKGAPGEDTALLHRKCSSDDPVTRSGSRRSDYDQEPIQCQGHDESS